MLTINVLPVGLVFLLVCTLRINALRKIVLHLSCISRLFSQNLSEIPYIFRTLSSPEFILNTKTTDRFSPPSLPATTSFSYLRKRPHDTKIQPTQTHPQNVPKTSILVTAKIRLIPNPRASLRFLSTFTTFNFASLVLGRMRLGKLQAWLAFSLGFHYLCLHEAFYLNCGHAGAVGGDHGGGS
jgi:hypothetical protein